MGMSTYNGFDGAYRARVQDELNAMWASGLWEPPTECAVCAQTDGAIHGHLEDYSRPETYVPLCALLRTLRAAAAPVPYGPRALTPGAAALAILEQLPHTSRGPGAEFWIRSVLREIAKAWGVVDVPAGLAFSGYCLDCGASVSAPGHLRAVECRSCGGELQAAEHRAWMWQEAQQVTGTAVELDRLLPHILATPVKVANIRKWHERGKLTGCAEERGTTFRLGDVLALHAAAQVRTRPRMAA